MKKIIYKESTIKRINNLKTNQTMRLGKHTIKYIEHKYNTIQCIICIFRNRVNCSKINCTNKSYIKV